jgi:hypothetical protein
MTAPPVRTAALAAARTRDSTDKRARVLAAVEALERAGDPVTFRAIAKAARVSTWLVYANGVREHIEAARRREANRAVIPAPSTPAGRPQAATVSLGTDLALAHQEIKRLRGECEKLQHRLRLQLGAEIDGPLRAELIARSAELETVNRRLVAERDARAAEAHAAKHRVTELEDDLSAARESLRRMIRFDNRGR